MSTAPRRPVPAAGMWAIALVAALVAALAGCNDFDTSDRECIAAVDCPGGTVCIGGRCTIASSCTTSADCGAGEFCSGGACVPDNGTTTGALDCVEIFDCWIQAGGSDAAFDPCYARGTSSGQQTIVAWLECVSLNCSAVDTTDPEALAACTQSACAAETSACQADSQTGTGSGTTGAYLDCDVEPCQSGLLCGTFDFERSYCFPPCGADGSCVGYAGGAAICGAAFGGDGVTSTHCLPLCSDTVSSSDCPPDWYCISNNQGVSVCSPTAGF